ncbi:flagellar biosynthetic protein FlhB [Jannaschia pagri]|uniref:Flagellar biosynthetic protein FlhB n=1 Tax=Jannaschia pagri TaxID=2829797 RepID=A0ABQ4NM48_9RHOB|nr:MULTISPECIES: flagellar type III secretion system protein FlhB [unclassified Jannaschia]GIT91630.1 flagellar biosynthetic protein FlhB [Jannaschia sp. AI_61]GIT95464.1 flagellar biosynthetic protein FlhB [Jannaschia sp. AI_62]
MSQEESGAEKTHEATPQKLSEARKKGEIVKSQDVAVAASYIGAFLCLAIAAGPATDLLINAGGALLQDADGMAEALRDRGSGYGGVVLWATLGSTGLLVGPMAGLVLVVLFAQQAIVVAPSKLRPRLSKISILSNAKNKFGANGLFEFAKSAAKMATYSALLAYVITSNLDDIVVSAALEPRKVVTLIPDMLGQFLLAVIIASATIATADYLWQRHSHLAKHRMTRQEVLDETKQSEGDPHLKARRRQRGQELATNKMLQDVPDAAVIVVNPTHYAVALKWSPMDPTPPVCVAKGVDEIAAKIREVATDNDVPIFSDPPTARALHASVDLGDIIDREHFAAVAAAIRFAQEMQQKAKAK